jgi:AcrR family transcriptional regulator
LPTKPTTEPRPPRPKRSYHHGDLRVALIDAALRLIAQHGVQGLALSDAAHLAGVSVAAPYRHFKDKEALLVEIAREGFVMFRDALAQAAQSHPRNRIKRLEEMGVAYVEFALQHRAHFKVMWEGSISKAKFPELGQIAYEAFLLLERAAIDLIEQLPGPRPARQQALVCAAWSVVHGYATLTLEHELDVVAPEQSGQKLLRQTLHLLLDQFAP